LMTAINRYMFTLQTTEEAPTIMSTRTFQPAAFHASA
jgi:hypothetical protein